MHALKGALLVCAAVTAAAAQSPEPPLAESRLSVHTLVREDIFSGWMDNDMERFARGERNIEALLEKRPGQRGNLLAWKAGASMFRAVRAHEAGKADEFQRYFQQARDAFAEAASLKSGNTGVPAITGGTLVVFADRLPEQHRAAAWSQAYDAYSALWNEQSSMVDKLPVHLRGELLAGMAQSAQRTGRAEEAAQFIDRMLAALPGTQYERMATQWKANPEAGRNTSLTCKTCHDAGRLSNRLAGLTQ
jgi:tetratricopeptide (TPR) repeat protein